jgi:TolB protein
METDVDNSERHAARSGRWGWAVAVAALAVATLSAGQAPPPQTPPQTQAPPVPQTQTPPQTQQPTDVQLVISGEGSAPPHYAVPDFIATTPDAAELGKTIGSVLWDDFAFERELDMIPRDTYKTIPVARTPEQVPFAAWRELGADAVVFGTIERTGHEVRVQVRLFNVRTRQSVFGKEYSGSDANVRAYAHTIADEIHLAQRALHGVARTKLAFSSDRNRERIVGTTLNRDVREIFMADYDGANQKRITTNRQLNIMPVWSPDAKSIAYTSYRKGYPDIFIALVYQGLQEEPTKGGTQNWLPVFSPDGSKIVFTSSRDGNPELYTINRNGSGLRRITNHPAIDTTPTWSPTGTQIAFTSDRGGTPQIYIVGADGTNLRRLTMNESYADRPTWSPAPFNEIAYAARSGAGFDIKVYDLATGQTHQLTFGEGTNESPAYSPNGRHVAFTSTRAGKVQVFTMDRQGRSVKQITKDGNNYTPSWSN